MTTLAVLRLAPDADRARVAALLDAEVRALWQLYSEGTVTHAYLTDDPGTVVLVLDPPPDQARARLDELPLLAEHLMTADVHALLPFRNWRRLFAEPDT